MRSTSQGSRQSVGFDTFWIEEDLHRYALDDLNEIAGGVVRRKQREIRAGAWLHTVNPALESIVPLLRSSSGRESFPL
jgi:hypothetical protein